MRFFLYIIKKNSVKSLLNLKTDANELLYFVADINTLEKYSSILKTRRYILNRRWILNERVLRTSLKFVSIKL